MMPFIDYSIKTAKVDDAWVITVKASGKSKAAISVLAANLSYSLGNTHQQWAEQAKAVQADKQETEEKKPAMGFVMDDEQSGNEDED